MSIVDDHFAQLQTLANHEYFEGATLSPISNGTYLVTLTGFALPAGWNKPRTNVYFLVPVGYPVARPDTFWTDPGLAPATGGVPMSTGNNQPPGVPPNLLWFSWHPGAWNPNHDNLVNYVSLISRRFEELK